MIWTFFLLFLAFLSLLGNLLHCQALQHLASKLPKNIRYARLICGGLHTFKQYYCCFKCHSIHSKEECIITNTNGDQSSISCSFIRFPNHPHEKKRQPCNMPLMKSVRLATGKVLVRPYLIYCL